jgi:hypothetical protein
MPRIILHHHINSHFSLDLLLLSVSLKHKSEFHFRLVRNQFSFDVSEQSQVHFWECLEEDGLEWEASSLLLKNSALDL